MRISYVQHTYIGGNIAATKTTTISRARPTEETRRERIKRNEEIKERESKGEARTRKRIRDLLSCNGQGARPIVAYTRPGIIVSSYYYHLHINSLCHVCKVYLRAISVVPSDVTRFQSQSINCTLKRRT